MVFEPKPGARIRLKSEEIVFTALVESGPASVFVYAEGGKEGTVYKVLKGKEFYAWKVFYPEYQDKRLLKNTENLLRYKDLAGLKVADRIVITTHSHPELVKTYPDLKYSVLMPWIEGDLWGNLMLNGNHLKKDNYFQIARSLLRVMCNLESNGLAHCDLSNNNFIIHKTLSAIELIDVEDMYAPDMPRPIPDISYGTPGYRTRWIAENGLWGPASDRFAAGILCAEILSWQNSKVRKCRAGDSSFFLDEEIGEKSERFQVMEENLSSYHSDLAKLFRKAWFSSQPEECPSVCEWLAVVDKLEPDTTKGQAETSLSVDAPHPVSTVHHPSTKEGIVVGIPPKMEVSHSVIEFGLIQQDTVASKIVIKNTGGSVLQGSIDCASWIETTPRTFTIQPDDKRAVTVTLKSTRPKPYRGTEYRTANALVINSNGGSEVIGAIYRLPKPPFYKTWFGIFSIFIVGLFCFFFLLGQWVQSIV